MSLSETLADSDWQRVLEAQFTKPYFKKLENIIHDEFHRGTTLPDSGKIFAAFNQTPFNEVKVVILGQDPYPTRGNPDGLAFSVPLDVPIPASLKYVFAELASDIKKPMPENGNLLRWARQGVLLLNVSLTVEEGTPGSHGWLQWWRFTNVAIRALSKERDNLVFLLWGRKAIEKEKWIERSKHYILTATHPSPRAGGGFSGCGHFTKANAYLKANGIGPIDW